MRIIYCDSVFDRKRVDPDYASEKSSATKNGFETSLMSFELLEEGQVEDCLKMVEESHKLIPAIYRGWMLTPSLYTSLYEGLLKKNIQLINSPTQYQHTHYLPDSYHLVEHHTPKSFWTEHLSNESLTSLLNRFGGDPVIVKDFVKSEKHHWTEACYIPNSSEVEEGLKIIKRFIELRGDYLNQGIVLRKFVELQHLTNHSESGMPLTKEFRMFFLEKKLHSIYQYWDEGEYGDSSPETEVFEKIAQSIQSNFFTMDVAQKVDGTWIIMELGDAQVSGLPENANIEVFYQKLSQMII
ncbi:MAG: ATP-grasp domain-containing protein [Flavobacteriales bacterium]|nr:ATP-grasp domain-containing protein [Flavobacteriales bacterium]